MSRGRPRHQSSRRRMYSGRQRDLRERRAHQEWNTPGAFDQESAPDADDPRELEPSNSWSLQLGARASAV